MACEFICDGCGKREQGKLTIFCWIQPEGWYSRGDEVDVQLACSRECVKKVSEKTGKTDIVAPF
jgi:hypothetical protein